MEFSSPFTANSSKLSAITDFLFLRKTSQALYNGMMKDKRATDPRNGIQILVASWGKLVIRDFENHVPLTNGDQIPGVHPWGLKRSFPKPNNVPTPRAQKIVKNVPFPACMHGSTPGKANDKCIIWNRPRASRSSDFELTRAVSIGNRSVRETIRD